MEHFCVFSCVAIAAHVNSCFRYGRKLESLIPCGEKHKGTASQKSE